MILFARFTSISISKIFFNSLRFLILKILTNFFLNHFIFFFDGEAIKMSFIYINIINFLVLLMYIYEFDFNDTKFNLINFSLYIKYQS